MLDDDRRAVARSELDLCHLGYAARGLPGGPQTHAFALAGYSGAAAAAKARAKTGENEPWTAWLVSWCWYVPHLVMLTWVFFRAADAHTAFEYLRGIVTLRGGLSNAAGPVTTVGFYVLLLLLLDVPQYMKRSHTVMLTWPAAGPGAAAGIMILLVLVLVQP